MLQGEYENLVEVRRNDEKISMKDLRLEEQLFIERMMLYEKMKNAPEDGLNAIKRKATSKDKFNNYCRDMNQKEIEKILKSVNITVNPTAVTEDYDYENYEAGSGDYEVATIVSVRKSDLDTAEDDITDIETVARIGDRSLLVEKLDLEDKDPKEAVESVINTFKIEANGRIEKVMKIENKKSENLLLVQFDSQEYRDAVLRDSRRPGAR